MPPGGQPLLPDGKSTVTDRTDRFSDSDCRISVTTCPDFVQLPLRKTPRSCEAFVAYNHTYSPAKHRLADVGDLQEIESESERLPKQPMLWSSKRYKEPMLWISSVKNEHFSLTSPASLHQSMRIGFDEQFFVHTHPLRHQHVKHEKIAGGRAGRLQKFGNTGHGGSIHFG